MSSEGLCHLRRRRLENDRLLRELLEMNVANGCCTITNGMTQRLELEVADN